MVQPIWKKTKVIYGKHEYPRFQRKEEKQHQQHLAILDLQALKTTKTSLSKAEIVEFILKIVPLATIVETLKMNTNEHTVLKKEHLAIELMKKPKTELKKIASVMAKTIVKQKQIHKNNYVRTPKRDIDGVVLFKENNHAIPWVNRTVVNCNLTSKICLHKGKCTCLYKGGCGTLETCPNMT